MLNMANAPQLTPKVPHGANTPASTPPVNAEALRVTSKNAALMPDNSIQQSGENYHNNSQSPLETGNTTAKTDSTALVLQQQYQTEIAAIREDLTLADLYEIVKEEAGTGDMIKKADRSFKEFVDCDEIIRYIKNTISMCLTENKIYEVLSIEKGWYRIVDDTGEDYLYPPEAFEIAEK